MPHPLVTQLRFARSEFARCLDGVTNEDARKRLLPVNCISWMVGHLADQENAYWVYLAQGRKLAPQLRGLVGFGQPASTPPLEEMWAAWREVTSAADEYLDTIDTDTLLSHFQWKDESFGESVGTLLQRNIYHYWFHTGEAHAVRQMLGHADLPQFVGSFGEATFRPE